MFAEAFQSKLRVQHFNKPLVHKLVASMNEIMAHVECYIKGQEINVENKTMDFKECSSDIFDLSNQ